MQVNVSAFTRGAVVHDKHIERSAYRMRLLRIEWELKAAFSAAERVLGLRDLLPYYIQRQLVVFDKPHARSVPQRYVA